MRAVCVARHPFLSEHLGRFFQQLGVRTVPCVGLAEAAERAPNLELDVVICEYDLLDPLTSAEWRDHPLLSRHPVIAVSLTRQPSDAYLRAASDVDGFLYLPTLEPDAARAMLTAFCHAHAINPPDLRPWPGTTAAPPA